MAVTLQIRGDKKAILINVLYVVYSIYKKRKYHFWKNMGKILALDLGDQWTGTALSDPLKIVARPYQTVATGHLADFLRDLFDKEIIDLVVIGYPKTMRGIESDQTRKVKSIYEILTKTFPEIKWILWDERLSSKRAESLGKNFSREEKLKSHSRAAAFILDSYLTFLQYQQNN